MHKIWSIIVLMLIQFNLISQVPYPAEIEKIKNEITNLNNQENELKTKLEDLKLNYWSNEINSWGIPELAPQDDLIKHSLMSLVYSEKHEQAIWVAHIISPDVKYGSIGRSNDFRPDPLVKSGSCNDRDYFIRDTLPDGNIKYDGFGFDRGHLAPSADFRWSAKALSESYYYSNMSPQLADFNRISWAKLEDMTRSYAERNQAPVMIVTGPLLREGLPRVDRAINKPTIPAYYYKMAVDRQNQRAVAFLMPNKKCEYPAEYYAVSIDSLEKITGINFFPNLPDEEEQKLEAMKDPKQFMAPKEMTDAKPLDPTSLPRNHFNTVQAKYYAGKNETITVCGTVVSTKLSSKGNVFLNLDKSFPNQIFTVSIFKDQLINFSYLPHEELIGKTIYVTGKVTDFNGTPSMSIQDEQSIKIEDEE
jgi:endonuclease G, mitochondrial